MPAPIEDTIRILLPKDFDFGWVLGFLAVWFGVNIIFGLGSISIGTDGASVAWQAHIGGFFAGLLLFSLFDPVPRATPHAADASSPDESGRV